MGGQPCWLVLELFHHTQYYLGAPPQLPQESSKTTLCWTVFGFKQTGKLSHGYGPFLRRLQMTRPIFQIGKLSQSNPAAPQGFLLAPAESGWGAVWS